MKKHEKLCGRDEAGVGRGVVSLTNLVSILGGRKMPPDLRLREGKIFEFDDWKIFVIVLL